MGYLSQYMSLQLGDVISTARPAWTIENASKFYEQEISYP